jgi:hypothetical protein
MLMTKMASPCWCLGMCTLAVWVAFLDYPRGERSSIAMNRFNKGCMCS